jgi:predicted nucleic acid-binding protein
VIYLDSSAIVKLVVREPESAALFEWLGGRAQPVSSIVATVEVFRALKRARAGRAAHERAVDVMDRIALLALDRRLVDRAAALDPPDLRSLDAIHLATALSVADDLDGLVTYDERLAAAARRVHLAVWDPA